MTNQQNSNQNSNGHYSCIQNATIKGRLAADPVPQYEENNGKPRTKVSARILVNRKNGSVDSWNIVEYQDANAQYPSANFRALAEFAKKGRFITVTGELEQNNRKNDQTGQYTTFMQIKPFPGQIKLESGGSEGGQQGEQQGGNNFGAQQQGGQQPQGNSFGQQPQQPQGNFGAQPQQPQGNFGQQPQGNFGGAQQGGFGQQPQQPQGNFGGAPQGGFGQPQGNFGGAPQGGFGAPQGNFGQ